MEQDLGRNIVSLENIAGELDVGMRQLRRLFVQHVGISPISYLQTQRLLMAKRLLAETTMSIAEIALASGFGSIRRCNALFKARYGTSPSAFRRNQSKPNEAKAQLISLSLSYRPPYAWNELLHFLASRAIAGVEWIHDGCYHRTITWEEKAGWVRVRHDEQKCRLHVDLSSELVPCVGALLSLVRRAFDLDASPSDIAELFSPCATLGSLVKQRPGLRIPGTMNAFETAVRAILGQQVSVASASALMNRVVNAFGKPIETPWPELNRCSLEPDCLEYESIPSLQACGLTKSKAATVMEFTKAVLEGRCSIEPSPDPERSIAQYEELKGIGPWTANYFGMRILNWPDSFLRDDLIVRRQLGGLRASEIESQSQRWSPWRAYAVMHLWTNAVNPMPTHLASHSTKRTLS
jgi:AraC family transcriptional regulator of adaptative response / DNA-3-methyladenine glycosylase II